MAVSAAQVPRQHKSTKMSGKTVHKKALLEQQRIEQQRKKQKKASFNRRFRINTTPRLGNTSPPATAAKAVGGFCECMSSTAVVSAPVAVLEEQLLPYGGARILRFILNAVAPGIGTLLWQRSISLSTTRYERRKKVTCLKDP